MRRLVAFVVKSLKQWTMSTEPAAATSQISSKQNNESFKRKNENYKWKNKKKRRAEDNESDHEDNLSRKVLGLPYKKRKYAMMLMYSGKGYVGMQINPNVHTIEHDIYAALVKSELVTQRQVDKNVMRFQRCARTDKGVSAAGQVVSLQISRLEYTKENEIENPVERMNSNLPDAIRVLDIVRATQGFDSKLKCDGRTYSYLCPTYTFTPVEQIVKDDYRIDDERLQLLNRLLRRYIGTHNFHNYTSGKLFKDPSSKRYIISFKAEDKYIFDDVEYILIRVKGQSFLLHHIRKMIGLVIAIIRGLTDESIMERSWQEDKVDVPIAPGLGLMLEKPHFTAYNRKFGTDHSHIDLDLYKEKIEEFKKNVIFKEIIETEKNERSMMEWLPTLHLHHYDVINKEDRNKLGYAVALLKQANAEKKESDSKVQSDQEATSNITECTNPKTDSIESSESQCGNIEQSGAQSEKTDEQSEMLDESSDVANPQTLSGTTSDTQNIDSTNSEVTEVPEQCPEDQTTSKADIKIQSNATT